MLLVPRQLRRSGMTGDVGYYGGRFTPAQAYAAQHGHGPGAAPMAPPPPPSTALPRATGPVQVLVVSYEQPTFSGEVLAEIARLERAGLVSLIDLLVVTRAADGGFETRPLPTDVHRAVPGAVEQLLIGPGGLVADNTTESGSWSLDEVVSPGATVAVALLEHRWAASLRAAVRRSGGAAVDESWLAEEDLQRLDHIVSARR